MEWLSQIPEAFRDFAAVIFAVVIAAGAAFNYLRGKKQGPEAPKVQEFFGKMSEMGPIEKLVENTGLLVQQQLRTNVALEASAKSQAKSANELSRAAEAFEQYLVDRRKERADRDLDEEVRRRVADGVKAAMDDAEKSRPRR